MKKLSLPLVLAILFVPIVAFAGDADVAQVVTGHPWIAVIGGILPILIRQMREDAGGPNVPAKYRLLIIVALSSVEGIVELVQNGATFQAAALATGVTAIPALFVEVLHLIYGQSAKTLSAVKAARADERGFVDVKALAWFAGCTACIVGAMIATVVACSPTQKQDAKTAVDTGLDIVRVLCPDLSCIDKLLASPKIDPATKDHLMAARAAVHTDAGK